MADGLEMGGGEILKLLIDHGADLAAIKQAVIRLDTIIGNGGGLVRRVDANRELCDKRETEHQRDRRELWDYIKTHKGKSLVIAGGGAGIVSAITEGIRQLWQITHTPTAVPPSVHPAVFPVAGAAGFTVMLCAVLAGRGKGGGNEDQ